MPLRSPAAKRYAEAVAGLARAERGGGAWERWRQDLTALADVLAPGQVQQMLESERTPLARKRELLDVVAGERVSPAGRNLALILARRRRLELLPDVLRWFEGLADRAQGVRRFTVTTATPLTDAQRSRLRQRLAGEGSGPAAAVAGALRAAARTVAGAVGAGDAVPPAHPEVHLAEEVDPAILGGLVVRQGDIIQDYSVRARLEALRDRLN